MIRKIHEEYFNGYKVLRISLLLKDVENIDEQDKIILDNHINNNHRGINETVLHLKRSVYFDNFISKITKTINNCEICSNKYERHPIEQKYAVTESPSKPLDIFHVDVYHIDNFFALTILDKFSRYAYAKMIESRNSINIVEALYNFFC